MSLALGIDLGTSGVRTAVLSEDGALLSQARGTYGAGQASREPEAWWAAAESCLTNQIASLRAAGHDPREIATVSVDGTSGSMVLVDDSLAPVTPALMYSDAGFEAEAAAIAALAPDPHITRGSGSSLARLLHLQKDPNAVRATHVLHQADFILARLRGKGGVSDENNALKLGYDPETGAWPAWFAEASVRPDILPSIVEAGAHLGPVDPLLARRLGLSEALQVHAGTTDSLAAFLAAAPLETGCAVTSLGTTMAIKIVSDTRIDAPQMGLYAHRLGGRWLVGGASNTGGGALLEVFSGAELAALSERIDPDAASPFDFYPLSRRGERFPVNDPALPPRLTPRPEDDVAYLHGLLESIARIEARCYALIAELGGPSPKRIITAGGGAQNAAWTRIRSRVIEKPVAAATHAEAAIGAARLPQMAAQVGPGEP
ncbi:MAG: FGGY-family carbohydrate kinase [Pseudomonadota bacterium]